MRYPAIVSLSVLIILSFAASAQIEGTWLSTKGNSRFGWAAAWDFSVTLNHADYISVEPNYQSWGSSRNYVNAYAVFAGYRHTLNRKGNRFFAEPLAGYSFGNTNITATNADGQAVTDPNGDTVKQKASGFAGGIGVGYIFPGRFPFNLEFRWEHVFVAESPKINVLGLHFAYTFVFRTKYS